MTRRHLTIPLLVAALAPAACGGSDEPKATSTAAAAPAKKPAALPQELKGTWKTTLRATTHTDAPKGGPPGRTDAGGGGQVGPDAGHPDSGSGAGTTSAA
jgi:hypothetical protein